MNDVLDEIKILMQAGMNTTTTKIKSFYQGEVMPVPQSYLPAMMIFGNSTEIIAKTTAEDQFVYDITIRVITDIKKQLKTAGTGEVIKVQQDLINIMEERNANGTLKNDTVLGILRDHIRGTDYMFNNNLTINYNIVAEGEWFYAKAEIRLEATTDLKAR